MNTEHRRGENPERTSNGQREREPAPQHRGSDGPSTGRPQPATSTRPGVASRPASGTGGPAETTSSGSPEQAGAVRASRDRAVVSWIALLVAVLLTVWEAISSLHLGGIDPANDPAAWNSFYPISLFVTLVLGLAAAVLGIVGIAQRRRPAWPGLAGLAVGLYAFIGAVFAWVGGLMDTGSSL